MSGRGATKGILKRCPDTAAERCRFMTLQEMFEDMNRAKEEPGRQPVILLLGGGMAAGKSTVREIIGKDGFWSKVSPCD